MTTTRQRLARSQNAVIARAALAVQRLIPVCVYCKIGDHEIPVEPGERCECACHYAGLRLFTSEEQINAAAHRNVMLESWKNLDRRKGLK